MAVLVKSGTAWIPGTLSGVQGAYGVLNDADVNVPIAAAHATLARIDIICYKIEDTQYAGAVNAASIVAVTGTPSGSPAVPTAPDNSITLAQIAVGAAVSTITNANITDVRAFIAGVGSLLVVRSKPERDALTGLYDGLAVVRTDLTANDINISNGAGTWFWHSRPTQNQTSTSQGTASTTYTNLATTGPSVSIETGTAALVTVSARFRNTGNNRTCMSYDVSGATAISASDPRALEAESTGWTKASFSYLETGLNSGTNVFKAEYRVTAGTGTWEDRLITVEPR
jgi:hypothetical protein